MAVDLTDKAAGEVKRIMADQKMDTAEVALRLYLKGGGCSGFNYMVDFDKEKRQGDLEFQSQGLRVLVDMKSYLYLNGLIMDFNDSLLNRGFVFRNPNAESTCGCGTSFAAKPAEEKTIKEIEEKQIVEKH